MQEHRERETTFSREEGKKESKKHSLLQKQRHKKCYKKKEL